MDYPIRELQEIAESIMYEKIMLPAGTIRKGNYVYDKSGKSVGKIHQGRFVRKTQVSDKHHEEIMHHVGSEGHSKWQKDFKKANGEDAKRMKDDGEGGEVDIANTHYKDLPDKWQAENRATGKSVADAIKSHSEKGKEFDKNFVEDAAKKVHDDWRDRNKSWAPKHQMVDYKDLPEEEKEKDRVFVRKGIDKHHEITKRK